MSNRNCTTKKTRLYSALGTKYILCRAGDRTNTQWNNTLNQDNLKHSGLGFGLVYCCFMALSAQTGYIVP